MTRAQRLHLALVCAAAHLAILVTIQIGDFCGYLVPPGGLSWKFAPYLLTLPAIQSQNLIVAGILGLMTYLVSFHTRLRWLGLPIFLIATLISLFDQVYYKIFLDHIHLSQSEGPQGINFAMLTKQFIREWDITFYVAATIALAATIYFSLILFRPPAQPGSPKLWFAFSALFLIAGVPRFSSTQYLGLNENPIWVLAQDWSRENLAGALAPNPGNAPPAAPIVPDQPTNHDPVLAALAAASHEISQPRNVILIILESTGAGNLLLDNGSPSREFTPNLAKLASAGVIFDNIYTSFPGTTRALMHLHSGGIDMPLADTSELVAPHNRPKLPIAFQRLGYSTALFSSERLNVEYCDIILENFGFQKIQDFNKDPANQIPQNSISAFGAREEYTLGLMKKWIDETTSSGKPFYLEYMNVATHYPYGAPPGYPTPVPPGERKADYINSLHYTDHAIGDLLAYLDARGLRQNTVIAVIGDHGEAFGNPHPTNLVHREHLYEENVRGFLLLTDPAVTRQPVRSHRLGRLGDVFPTLTAWVSPAGTRPETVRAQNLFELDFVQRPIHFYKLASPEKWGLRDGNWKYIGKIRVEEDELYDLATDPLEQVNVALDHLSAIANYRALCKEWLTESKPHLQQR